MSERTDLPKIKPPEQPSLFNHEAGKWGILGSLIGFIPASLAHMAGHPKLTSAISTAAFLGGTLYGAVTGKAQQEREMTEGRTVKDPGYWNKGIVSGLTAATIINLPFTLAGKALPLSGAMALASVITGSVMRKNSLQRDFDQSVALRDQQQAQILAAAQGLGKSQQPNYMNSVNPAEAATLAQAQSATANHADTLAQQAPTVAAR